MRFGFPIAIRYYWSRTAGWFWICNCLLYADSDVRVASIAKVRESSRQDEEENVEDPENPENEDEETTEE